MLIQDISYPGLFGSGFHFGWEPLIGTIFITGKFFGKGDGDLAIIWETLGFLRGGII
jgi:hypothetical protein